MLNRDAKSSRRFSDELLTNSLRTMVRQITPCWFTVVGRQRVRNGLRLSRN
jgi:hypothetical protein